MSIPLQKIYFMLSKGKSEGQITCSDKQNHIKPHMLPVTLAIPGEVGILRKRCPALLIKPHRNAFVIKIEYFPN